MEEIRAEPARMQAFINSVRTDKRGLFSLARQALAFPNARLSRSASPERGRGDLPLWRASISRPP